MRFSVLALSILCLVCCGVGSGAPFDFQDLPQWKRANKVPKGECVS